MEHRTSHDSLSAVSFRLATRADLPALRALIQQSARTLATGDYTTEQIEAALLTAWAVDTQLLRDHTYYVAEEGRREEGRDTLVACGGWSFRGTLFGGDAKPGRQPEVLDPARDAARIRAFFVHPDWARRGLGRRLLRICEGEAVRQGFDQAELVATLPGARLYQAYGYVSEQPRDYPLPNGQHIVFVPMRKTLKMRRPSSTSAEGK